jgi:alkanesulfonate monooxygenase SsuD/methylene tetrahydromethanopterin reductase-like flavin-dependent oxidoreductase (luciferase family)
MEFPPAGQRLEALNEAVQICRAMFTEHLPRFKGAYYHITEPLNVPGPINPDGPPILIGGGGEKVLIPMAARLGDACNFFGGPATVAHKIKVLEDACATVGRDPREITKTWLGTAIIANSEQELQDSLELLGGRLRLPPSATRGMALCGSRAEVQRQVAEYRAVGVDGMIVTLLNPGDLGHLHEIGTTIRGVLCGG